MAAITVAAGTAQTIAALRAGADQSRQAQTMVARLEAQLHRQSAIRWEVVDRQLLDPGLSRSLQAAQIEMTALLEAVDRVERASFGLQAVAVAVVDYEAALEEQLVAAGNDPTLAAEIGRTTVAPSLAVLERAREAAATRLEEAARTTGLAADLGALTALMSAAILISLLFRKWERVRRHHAFIDGEQTGLQLSEARFRSLVMHASDLMTVIGTDGRVAYVSPSADRLLGAGHSMLGRSLIDLVHPDDRLAVESILADAANLAGPPRSAEWRLQHASGEWRLFEHMTSHGRGSLRGGLVLNSRDVTERRRLEGALLHRANHDPLTGLANRTMAAEMLEHGLARGRRHGGTLGLLLLDLDDFKAVNDSLGHSAGDALLMTIADRLREAIRADSLIARIGGDEFAVIVDDLDTPERASEIARRIQAVLKAPIDVAGRQVSASVSIGIATATAGALSVEMLLRQADIAMYAAKRRGRGAYEHFDPAIHDVAFDRLEQEQDLRAAVEAGQFVNHYQPIHDLRSGVIVGFEALVRWAHPLRGLVGPGDFVPVAEQTGLIVEIGRSVLRTAVADLASWDVLPGAPRDRWVSVNLAPSQLADESLLADIDGALAASGLAPHRLVLELTEGSVMRDPAVAAVKLGRLKVMGVRLAIDDFGTGYSSLGHLHDYPFDLLKIDRSFIEDLADPGIGATLAPVIVDLARRLGLTTVAEGIETQEQLAVLRSLRCELGQGFLMHRPMPAEAASRALGFELSKPAETRRSRPRLASTA